MWCGRLWQVPPEGRGPSGAPVLGTSCILAVADVSQELENSVQESLGPRKQAMRTLNRCQGNLHHITAENAQLKAWPL